AVPAEIRLARLRARERARYGEAAMGAGGARHAKAEAFLAWAARYDDGEPVERSRAMHERWLAALPCAVLRLEGPAAVDAHVAAVLDALSRASG
ncbi:MAG TPA: hypothetical protein VFL90_07495, partial [Methylomirabilota bacterium]|nr:hypothetical protein [Methylomirabilota bacterium]